MLQIGLQELETGQYKLVFRSTLFGDIRCKFETKQELLVYLNMVRSNLTNMLVEENLSTECAILKQLDDQILELEATRYEDFKLKE